MRPRSEIRPTQPTTPNSSTDRALGTLWSWTWGLLFICTMTVLSMATQKFSGYPGTQVVEAHSTQQNCCPQ
jgi:hypothetical protein